MECKLVAYGTMPDGATQVLIRSYLEKDDRMDAHKVTFYSVDTALNTAVKARFAAEAERDAALAELAELKKDDL